MMGLLMHLILWKFTPVFLKTIMFQFTKIILLYLYAVDQKFLQ